MPHIKTQDLAVGQTRAQLRASRDGKTQTLVVAARVPTQPGTRPLLTSQALVSDLIAVIQGRAAVDYGAEKRTYTIDIPEPS